MASKGVPVSFTFHGLPAGEFVGDVPMHPGEYLYDAYRGIGHLEFVSHLKKHGNAECAFESLDGTAYFVVKGIHPLHRLQVSAVSRMPILPNFKERMGLKERLFGPDPANGGN